jgi:hypothetical protein
MHLRRLAVAFAFTPLAHESRLTSCSRDGGSSSPRVTEATAASRPMRSVRVSRGFAPPRRPRRAIVTRWRAGVGISSAETAVTMSGPHALVERNESAGVSVGVVVHTPLRDCLPAGIDRHQGDQNSEDKQHPHDTLLPPHRPLKPVRARDCRSPARAGRESRERPRAAAQNPIAICLEREVNVRTATNARMRDGVLSENLLCATFVPGLACGQAQCRRVRLGAVGMAHHFCGVGDALALPGFPTERCTPIASRSS